MRRTQRYVMFQITGRKMYSILFHFVKSEKKLFNQDIFQR